MFSVRQNGEQWEVLGADGEVIDSFAGYGDALAFLGDRLAAEGALAVSQGQTNDAGLLPEVWEDVSGICFSQPTGDGRDFTNCAWSWRDPAVSTLPLMLQTTTDMGHFGAELAGYMVELHDNVTPHASGRFYDSEAGRQLRDMLLNGRRFGVSVDPGHVEAEWTCLEEDEDGWCISDRIDFLAYCVIGLTATPFPGFAEAAIQLRGTQAMAAGAVVPTSTPAVVDEPAAAAAPTAEPARPRSGLSIPVAPPAAWFAVPEPQPGDSGMLDVYGMPAQELLVEQRDGSMAVPLTILDTGQWFGHLAARGNPHTGYPGRNITVPVSRRAYADFNLGVVHAEGGERVAAGTMVFGCEHAPLRDANGAVIAAGPTRDFYAHSGATWGQGRFVEGQFGPWGCGALLPEVTEPQLRTLRALTLSGDWREIAGALELIGVLAVNVPGFRVTRDAMVASGVVDIPAPRASGLDVGGETRALVAAGTVRRCAQCQERALVAAGGYPDVAPALTTVDLANRLERLERLLVTVEGRTRHLLPAEGAARARRLGVPANGS